MEEEIAREYASGRWRPVAEAAPCFVECRLQAIRQASCLKRVMLALRTAGQIMADLPASG